MDSEELQQIHRLLALVDRYGLAELVVREEGVDLTIRGPAGIAPTPVPSVAVVALPGATDSRDAEGEPASRDDTDSDPADPSHPSHPSDLPADDSRQAIRSPMTGIFYRSASPDDPPFVEVGDEVTVGQTIGLIEAMKVFSEIPAEMSGRVVRVVAETGVLINQGDVLMLLEPSNTSV